MNENLLGKKPINKKFIAIIVAAILLVVGIFVTVSTVTKDGKKDDKKTEEKYDGPIANTNPDIVKDFELQGLKFNNIALITDGTTSTLTMDVTNPTKQLIKMKSIEIVLKDKDGKELTTLLGYFGEEVPAGVTRSISAQAEIDLTKAVKKEIRITK